MACLVIVFGVHLRAWRDLCVLGGWRGHLNYCSDKRFDFDTKITKFKGLLQACFVIEAMISTIILEREGEELSASIAGAVQHSLKK